MTDERAGPNTLPDLLGADVWNELATTMRVREYTEGDKIVVQGDLSPDFHIIESGFACVTAMAPDGELRELGRLRPGDCIGEMSLLTGEPASADVIAVTPVTAYAISQQQVRELGELRVRLIGTLSTILAGRLRSANERLLQRGGANVIALFTNPQALSALAGLPDAIGRVVHRPVLVAALGDELGQALAQITRSGANISISTLGADEPLAPFLDAASRDYEHILLICDDQRAIVPDVDAGHAYNVALADQARHSIGVRKRTRKTIIIGGEEPSTAAGLRRMSDRLGAEVVAIVQQPDAGQEIERLARVLMRRRVGVAFGAGAAKGLAHLGVLRALTAMGVPIDVVSGASIGSAVAAGVASGMDVDELEALVNRVAKKIVRPAIPLYSLLSNAGIREEIRRASGETRIEDLNLPLAIVAVDLIRRAEVTFTSGLVWPRIIASTAIPGVYPALSAAGTYLVDGGILTPVPARQCRELGADIVIGVRLTATRTSPRERIDHPPGRPLAVEAMIRSFEIMQNRISEISHQPCDITVEVQVEGTGGLRDFKRGVEFAALGDQATRSAAPALTEKLPYVKEAAP